MNNTVLVLNRDMAALSHPCVEIDIHLQYRSVLEGFLPVRYQRAFLATLTCWAQMDFKLAGSSEEVCF